MGERGKSEVQLQIFVFTGPCRLSRQKSILARILGNGSSFPGFFCPLPNREIVHTQISSDALVPLCMSCVITVFVRISLKKSRPSSTYSPSNEIACDEKGQKITESSLT